MTALFEWIPGSTPLLISIPHDGRWIPPDLAARMTDAGRAIPDTDWHVARLYEFARDLGAGIVSANVSRYVVDLNRAASDEALYPGQVSTGLCPTASFDGEPIYRGDASPDAAEKRARVAAYWRPYHDRLAASLGEIRANFGYALLWDAHSIPGEVPRLFDGLLPDLNVGTNAGRSCARHIEAAVANVADASPYSSIVNGRFKGGYITRHYGDPGRDVHAIQLELAQRCYMDEKTRRFDEADATPLRQTIAGMLQAFLAAAEAVHA